MKKEKILSSVFIAMLSVAAFATPATEITAVEQQPVATVVAAQSQAAAASLPDVSMILLYILIGLVVLVVFSLIVFFLFKTKIQDLIGLPTIVSELQDQIKTKASIVQANTILDQMQNKTPALGRTTTLREKIDSIWAQIQNNASNSGNNVSNSLETIMNNQKIINTNITNIKTSLDSSGITNVLEKCADKTNEIGDNLNKIAPELKAMNDRMQKLLDEKPELVDFSIAHAVDLLKQCNSEGISSAEQIRDMNAFAKECKAAQFKLSEIADSKKYYDARKETEKQISDLQSAKESLEKKNNELQDRQKSMTEENERVKEEKKTLESQKNELEQNLEQVTDDKNKLELFVKSLRPESIDADSLFALLQNSSPALRSETLVLIVQLYWFAQLSRNTPAKIKAAFVKVDETLYELFTEEQEILQAIRQSIQKFVNAEIFKDTSYEISWPTLDSSASEHEDHYNRENNEGNRICKVRSAVILNSGKIESVARIYTSL